MKHFNPDLPTKSIQKITVYANKITLTGSSGTANITINGILNTTIATYAGASLTTTAANWVAANYVYYYALGYVVSNAAQVITVLPRYGWETVNKINATIANATTDLSGTLAGTCVVDTSKAKTWRLTLNNNITMNRPVEAADGDEVQIEFINPSTYTVAWATNGFYFIGGTEPTVTTSGRDIFKAVFQATNTAKVHNLTLSGSSGTGNVSMGGVTKLATYNASPTQTATDFVAANAAAYAAIGITLTSNGAVLIFTTTDSTKYMAPPTFTNVTLTLAGSTATVMGGRWLVTLGAQDIKQ
jgi:hypothetical protein